MNRIIIPTALLTLFLAACSPDDAQNVPVLVVDSAVCDSNQESTVYDIGSFEISFLEPNSSESADIWQGPVCIRDIRNNSVCALDISLLERVSEIEGSRNISIHSFSGSTERTYVVDPEDCSIQSVVEM